MLPSTCKLTSRNVGTAPQLLSSDTMPRGSASMRTLSQLDSSISLTAARRPQPPHTRTQSQRVHATLRRPQARRCSLAHAGSLHACLNDARVYPIFMLSMLTILRCPEMPSILPAASVAAGNTTACYRRAAGHLPNAYLAARLPFPSLPRAPANTSRLYHGSSGGSFWWLCARQRLRTVHVPDTMLRTLQSSLRGLSGRERMLTRDTGEPP